MSAILIIAFVVIGLAAMAANSTDEPADHYAEQLRQLLNRENDHD